MSKSADAFRTISEVAEDLDVPKHVLRFWENKFPQIRPMKRGGGRRYYRPEDLELLSGIRQLLHGEGYTIKGVQKILREQGVEIVKRCWRVVAQSSRLVRGARRRPGAGGGSAAAKGSRETQLRKSIAAAVRELEACRKLLLRGRQGKRLASDPRSGADRADERRWLA